MSSFNQRVEAVSPMSSFKAEWLISSTAPSVYQRNSRLYSLLLHLDESRNRKTCIREKGKKLPFLVQATKILEFITTAYLSYTDI
jgi:hypothetical protein